MHTFGYKLVAAQPKQSREDAQAVAPTQQPMRAGTDKIRRNPSTDQLKVRRQMARSAASIELRNDGPGRAIATMPDGTEIDYSLVDLIADNTDLPLDAIQEMVADVKNADATGVARMSIPMGNDTVIGARKMNPSRTASRHLAYGFGEWTHDTRPAYAPPGTEQWYTEVWNLDTPISASAPEGSYYSCMVYRRPSGEWAYMVSFISVNGGERDITDGPCENSTDGMMKVNSVLRELMSTGFSEDDLAAEGSLHTAAPLDMVFDTVYYNLRRVSQGAPRDTALTSLLAAMDAARGNTDLMHRAVAYWTPIMETAMRRPGTADRLPSAVEASSWVSGMIADPTWGGLRAGASRRTAEERTLEDSDVLEEEGDDTSVVIARARAAQFPGAMASTLASKVAAGDLRSKVRAAGPRVYKFDSPGIEQWFNQVLQATSDATLDYLWDNYADTAITQNAFEADYARTGDEAYAEAVAMHIGETSDIPFPRDPGEDARMHQLLLEKASREKVFCADCARLIKAHPGGSEYYPSDPFLDRQCGKSASQCTGKSEYDFLVSQSSRHAIRREAGPAGMRGHNLMTQETRKSLPPLYSQDGKGKDAIAFVKFFSPYSNWTWYATEFDGEDSFFGLVVGSETELGYFSLSELESAVIGGGIPAVERDLYWTPATIGDIRSGKTSSRKTAGDKSFTGLQPNSWYVTDRAGSISAGPHDSEDRSRQLFALGPEFARIFKTDAEGNGTVNNVNSKARVWYSHKEAGGWGPVPGHGPIEGGGPNCPNCGSSDVDLPSDDQEGYYNEWVCQQCGNRFDSEEALSYDQAKGLWRSKYDKQWIKEQERKNRRGSRHTALNWRHADWSKSQDYWYLVPADIPGGRHFVNVVAYMPGETPGYAVRIMNADGGEYDADTVAASDSFGDLEGAKAYVERFFAHTSSKTAGESAGGEISRRLKNWVLGDPNCPHTTVVPSDNVIKPLECANCGYGMSYEEAEAAKGQMSLFGARTVAGYEDSYNGGKTITRAQYDRMVPHEYAGPGTPLHPDAPGYWAMYLGDGGTTLVTGLTMEGSKTADLNTDDPVEWAGYLADEAGGASIALLSGSDLLKVIGQIDADHLGAGDFAIVEWAYQRAVAAGSASVTRLSGTDVKRLVELTKYDSRRMATKDINENEVEGLPDDETWIDNEGNFQVDAALRSIIKERK